MRFPIIWITAVIEIWSENITEDLWAGKEINVIGEWKQRRTLFRNCEKKNLKTGRTSSLKLYLLP